MDLVCAACSESDRCNTIDPTAHFIESDRRRRALPTRAGPTPIRMILAGPRYCPVTRIRPLRRRPELEGASLPHSAGPPAGGGRAGPALAETWRRHGGGCAGSDPGIAGRTRRPQRTARCQ